MTFPKFSEIKSFLLGQYFADGVKVTLGVLLPALVFSFWDDFKTGLIISLGAFFVSISDTSGPISHRRAGMLVACLSVFVSALVTGFVNDNAFILGVVIALFCFVFAMYTSYGNRAASVGTAALLAMAISIDQHKTSGDNWGYALCVLAGGLWYTGLSLSIMEIRPFRVAQQALGECILHIAHYIRLKGNFFLDKVEVPSNFQKLAKQQVKVNEHQNNVREMLFKARVKVGDSVRAGRILIMVFVDSLDVFEQSMSAHYDYNELRRMYGLYKVLDHFGQAIIMVADELSNLGHALNNNEQPKRKYPINRTLKGLKEEIDILAQKGERVLMLRKIFVNLKSISKRVNNMFHIFQQEEVAFLSKDREESLSKFVSHQDFDPKVLINNFTFQSSVFRHALRLSLTCLVGYLISQQLTLGQHSYWVVLTIVVILRPGFSITKKRNMERIIGTAIGGTTGVLILWWVEDITARFFIMVVFMVLAYSFWRIRYVLGVVFMTPFIFILYGFIYPEANFMIARERILDTFLGSGLAFLASHYLFPIWESRGIHVLMSNALKANLEYLQQLTFRFEPKAFDEIAYRLARKKLHLETANLSAAFQRMLEEPKGKQKNKEAMHQFMVLTHMLASYLSTLSTNLVRSDLVLSTQDQVIMLKRSRNHLQKTIKTLSGQKFRITFPALGKEDLLKPEIDQEADLLSEQLYLIQKTCADIEKVSEEV